MWAWLVSLFASKAVPAVQHALWRTVSVVCVLGIVAIIGLGIKRVIFPSPTTTQTGGISYNYKIDVGMGGCLRIPSLPEKK